MQNHPADQEPRRVLGSFFAPKSQNTPTWEQRKLGEIANFSKGVGYSKNDLCEEGTPIILYGRLYTKYETCIFDVDTFVKEKAGSVYSKGGEVIVPASGETAEDISIASVVVKPGILLGGDLNIVSPTTEYDSAFLALTISSGAAHKYLSSLAQGKSVVHLHNADIQSVSAKFPTKREQEKIHLLFGKIDTLITLHQRKHEKLVNIKKSMLDKMFPKNGASVPEIRFKGFTDPWEQRKLSDIVEKVTEKNAGLQYIETFTNSAEFGIISQRDFFDHDISKIGSLDGYYVVHNEDFVYNPRISVTAPVGPINRNKLGRTGVMSPLYTVFRPHDIDTTYLEHFFKSGYWHSFMNFNGDSGARSDRFSIKDSVFFEMPIPTPDIEEQKKIGEFLTQLDTLITLHQRKLEKLQNIKKSCLEKMFV